MIYSLLAMCIYLIVILCKVRTHLKDMQQGQDINKTMYEVYDIMVINIYNFFIIFNIPIVLMFKSKGYIGNLSIYYVGLKSCFCGIQFWYFNL